MHIIEASLLVGAVGDYLLQWRVGDTNRYGLGAYFKRHGSGESICIAAGMMGVLNYVYTLVDPAVHTIPFVAYGGILDVVFRQYHPLFFTSLGDYYKAMSPGMSVVWGMIPQLLVFGVASVL